MLPQEAQANLALILRNKLRGEARRAVHGVALNTVPAFMDFLKTLYLPAKSVYQLQGELGRIFQHDDEGVLTYSNRVKDIGNRISDAYKQSHAGVVDDAFKRSLDVDLVECFNRGLRPEIENKITRNQSFSETMKEAIDIERKEQAKSVLRNSRSTKFNNYNQFSPRRDKIHHIQESKQCLSCGKYGHNSENCRSNSRSSQSPERGGNRDSRPDRNNFQRQQNNNSYRRYQDFRGTERNGGSAYNSNSAQRVTCRFCKNIGHSINECRKLEYWTNQKNPRNTSSNNQVSEPRDNSQQRSVKHPRSEVGTNQATRVATALLNRGSNVPVVKVNSKDFLEPTLLMIDTGSSLNLIKSKHIAPHVQVDTSEIVQISGITKDYVSTLGRTEIQILDSEVTFHLVKDDFPIEDDGLIGSEFFRTYHADVSYYDRCLRWGINSIPFMKLETIIVPARTKGHFYVRVANPEVKVGYVPRQFISEGVFLGEALVTNSDGKAHLYLINTTDEEIEVAVPVLNIEPYEEYTNENDATTNITDVTVNKPEATPALLHAAAGSNQLLPEAKETQAPREKDKAEISCEDHEEPTYKSYKDSELYAIPDNSCSDEAQNEPHNVEEIHKGSAKTAYVVQQNDRVSQIKSLLRLDHLNPEEKESIQMHLEEFQDRYYLPGEKLKSTNVLKHRIITTDEVPINFRQYRYPPTLKEEINRQVNDLLDGGIIQPSKSPYNSPVWIVPKKADSKGNKRWRMVLDYRALNEKTISDAYPLPLINEILDQLGGAVYFSTFDLASGFHQIEMHPEDRHKTAFSTPYGHYEFVRMPFGLKNAPATFQRLMNQVLMGVQGSDAFVYLDDIVIYASTLEEHELKLERLMKRLRGAQLKLQPDKCEFLRREVAYLGHIIGKDGVKPDPAKLSAVKNFPRPKNAKNIRQFLGLAGYYRRFIDNFSQIARPLTILLKKDAPFKWQEQQQAAFETLRDKLCEEPVLQYPDFTQPFIVTTDASGTAVGGILSQGPLGKDRPIAYTSRVLNDTEQRYSTYEKEAVAILHSVSQFRPYLYGKRFKLVTDHKPLVWIHTSKDPTSRLTRWRLRLEEYEYEVVHKAGKMNVNADALSRNPCEEVSSGDEPESRPQHVYPIKKRARMVTDTGETDEEDEPLATRLRKQAQASASKAPAKPSTKPASKRPDEQSQGPASDMLITDDAPIASRLRSRGNKGAPTTSKEKPKAKAIRRKAKRQKSPVVNRAENEIPLQGNVLCQNSLLANFGDDETFSISGESEEYIFDRSDSDSENNYQQQEAVEKPAEITSSLQITSNEQLFMRKDNYLYFLSETGEPCDEGSKKLADRRSLPKFRNLSLGSISVIKHNSKHHIAMVIQTKSGARMDHHTFPAMQRELKKVVEGLELRSVSVAKTKEINSMKWEYVLTTLKKAFADTTTKLIVCLGLIKYPEPAERKEIISEAHASAMGGHKGVTKTYNRIRQRYYWEDMKNNISEYIQHCLPCHLKKLVRVKTRQPMIITDTPDSAFDKISMDIVGPLPRTEKGNEYILTMQDLLTKYSLAVALSRATSANIADALIKHCICIFGAPKTVLTDQGANFLSSLMKDVAKKFKIKQCRTTAFHPQSNGSLERSHHSLVEYLKQYVNRDDEWDEWLELATFSYNTSVHEGTKHTPFELVFGKLARQPSYDPPADNEPSRTYGGYLVELATKLHDTQEIARNHLIAAKERSKKYYDRKVNAHEFNLGDCVYLQRGKKQGKFGDHYTGPHEIIEIMRDGNIKIKIGRETRIVHPNRLRYSHIDLGESSEKNYL